MPSFRVTKFKINWDNNPSENSENIPPPKMDPNQMSSENSQVNIDITYYVIHPYRINQFYFQSLEGPLKTANNGSQAVVYILQ